MKHKPILSIQWDADTTDGKTIQQDLLLKRFLQRVPFFSSYQAARVFSTKTQTTALFCFLECLSAGYDWELVLPPTSAGVWREQAAGCSLIWPSKASSQMSAADWVSPQKLTPADKKRFLWPNKSLFDSCSILPSCFSSSSSLPIKKVSFKYI